MLHLCLVVEASLNQSGMEQSDGDHQGHCLATKRSVGDRETLRRGAGDTSACRCTYLVLLRSLSF
eukprot:COSAG02_NODE_2638_length_8353_cov_13.889145_2_plen_65_part_00